MRSDDLFHSRPMDTLSRWIVHSIIQSLFQTLHQKRHLGWSLSQPPECFLYRSSGKNVLSRSSSSVRCSSAVVWIFCISVNKWEPWHDLFLEGCERMEIHKISSESDKYRASYTSRNCEKVYLNTVTDNPDGRKEKKNNEYYYPGRFLLCNLVIMRCSS